MSSHPTRSLRLKCDDATGYANVIELRTDAYLNNKDDHMNAGNVHTKNRPQVHCYSISLQRAIYALTVNMIAHRPVHQYENVTL